LLGGIWIEGSNGQTGDSVYTAFMLQEAVRLAQRPQKQSGEKDKVLIIGLGVGITNNSFRRHGIVTTVVDIDPVVCDYASQFFDLVRPDAIHIEDARSWVHDRAALHKSDIAKGKVPLFDMVIHDCFSGGSVPGHLFTIEFWDDLKQVVDPDGIVAVNFAGKIGSNAARSIFSTLQRSFKQCRVFHDRVSFIYKDGDFLNMVFFCTLSTNPLQFRNSTEQDYLGSKNREYLLGAFEQLEVQPHEIYGNLTDSANNTWILTDLHNPLKEYQQNTGLEHWQIMRQIINDDAWETY